MPIRVVCAIIEKKGAILAARRGPRQDHAGLWEFPGGKVELGEDDRTALVREIDEELGCGIEPDSLIGSTRCTTPSGVAIELVAYAARVTSGAVHPREHDAVRWIDPHGDARLDWAPPDRVILQQYRERKACSRSG